MRRDTKRNRRRVIAVAREILSENPSSTTMTMIADAAEIGTATAYRYFSSMEDLISAVVLDIVLDLETHTQESDKSGPDLLVDAMNHWIGLIIEHGIAMIQLRSPRGFLERLWTEEPVISAVSRVWGPLILENYPDRVHSTEELHLAVMLMNQLSDPRDMRELHMELGLSTEQISRMVIATFEGALLPWLQGTQTERSRG